MKDKPNILIIVGSQVISGAEHVLADYLHASRISSHVTIWHADTPQLSAFFGSLPVAETRAVPSLLPAGARRQKSPLALVKKAWRVISFSLTAHSASIRKDFTIVVGNNTGDILFVKAFRKTRRALLVHDDISSQKGLKLLFRLYHSRIETFAAVSKAVKTSLGQSGVPPEKIRVIYNGLPSRPLIPRASAKTTLTILFVGQISEGKDPLSTLVFCRLLAAQTKKSVICHMIYNQEDPVVRSSLNAAVQDAQGLFEIHLHADMDRKRIHTFYETADFFFHPSINDALPTTILEAFQHGLPTIARSIGGVPEIITHGEDGILFRENDELHSCAETVAAMDAQTYRTMSEHAYHTFSTRFTIEEKVRALDIFLGFADTPEQRGEA
ncbi:MAG: glycosyltransferase family 4 protein [Spirochaetia bacterium]|nr:glycosyltransferase family 4 protein [Spirochaetia bacterium]MCF7941091.1 glycosyltransferase family 4 protein [Spirochaetia bacterium]